MGVSIDMLRPSAAMHGAQPQHIFAEKSVVSPLSLSWQQVPAVPKERNAGSVCTGTWLSSPAQAGLHFLKRKPSAEAQL
jgi:hypothetical protein